MNNFIEYFYRIKTDEIKYDGKYYSFTYDYYHYRLYVIDDNINIDYLISLNKRLLGSTLISEIVININYKYISTYNNINYILIKVFVNPDKKIRLNELVSFDYSLYNNTISSNWGILWSNKIDYLERLISENNKKYPLMADSFNYFLGMAENAIGYYNSIIIPKNYNLFISHHNLSFNNSIELVYNPLNIFFDYIARDIGEYIKYSFFTNNKNIFNELSLLINDLSVIDVKLIIARIMYPSFYFNLYEDILIYNKDEKVLLKIIEKLDDYQKYLANIIDYFGNIYDIDYISWLKKD